MVQRVATHHVTQLVSEQGEHLVVVEQLQRPGVDHDERMVHAVGPGVDKRGLRHEQLRPVGPVERGEGVRVECVHPRELRRADAHRVRLEQEADAALAQEADDLLDDLIEPGNGAEGLQGRPVRGVLPCDRRDLGEDLARARRRETRGFGHAILLRER